MKKIISFVLSLTLICSSIQVFAASPIALKDIDLDYKILIYQANKNEKIIGSLITYPALAILSNRDGSSYINYSEDYGKTLKEINLTELLEGFSANGIIWDTTIYPGYTIYGSKDGNIAMYHSANFKNWRPIYWEEPIQGTIMSVNISGFGYDIYFTDGKKNYVINTFSAAGKIIDKPIEFPNKLPTLFCGAGEYSFYTDGNKLYKTSDNKTYDVINLENVKRIFDIRLQKPVCSDAAVRISYFDNNDKILQKQIIIKPIEEPVWIPEDVPEKDLINFEKIGTDISFSGSWGYPMLLSDERNVYITYLKRDSKRLPCDKKSVSWLSQYAQPDTWAYQDIELMAEKNVLTPRTTPNNYSAYISRQLFGEYIYNLISSKKEILTNKMIFDDTKDEYINSLGDIDIIRGDNGKFNPQDLITREQAAAILARILLYFGTGTSGDKKYTIDDVSNISNWAKHDVEFLYSYGIFTGDNLGNFNPQQNMTVQEALVTIRRIEKMINTSEYCELCG